MLFCKQARMLHVKMCARINNVSTPDLLALIKKNSLTEKEERELKTNRQLLTECDDLFTKKSYSKGGNSAKKKKVTYFDPVRYVSDILIYTRPVYHIAGNIDGKKFNELTSKYLKIAFDKF